MKRVYTRRPRAGVYNGIASSETVGICQEGSGPFSPPAREKCWNNRDEGDGLLNSWGSAGFGGSSGGVCPSQCASQDDVSAGRMDQRNGCSIRAASVAPPSAVRCSAQPARRSCRCLHRGRGAPR